MKPTTLTCTLGGLDLSSYIKEEAPKYSFNRPSLMDVSVQAEYPYSAGERVKVYDVLATIGFNLLFDDAYEGSKHEDLERLQRIGESLKFDMEHPGTDNLIDRHTVAFITGLNVSLPYTTSRRVDISLKEAYRYVVDPCDALTYWTKDAGGTLSVVTSGIKEGTGAIRVQESSTVMQYAFLKPPDPFDASPYNWIGFWFKIGTKSNLNYLRVVCRQDINSSDWAYYDYEGLIPLANKWYFVRIDQDDFTLGGVFDWTRCRLVEFQFIYNSLVDIDAHIDEVCFIE